MMQLVPSCMGAFNPFLGTHFFHSVYLIVLEELLCTVASGACSGGTVVYSSEWGMFWRNCCVQ